MEIAIAGGGIVGLALALHLHRHGISCRVYESTADIREIGVGITLLPHGMRELAALGLQEALCAAGIETRESAFFNRFGQRIYREPRGRHAGYAFPEIGIRRGRLHGILYRAVCDRLGHASVRTGCRCLHVTEDAAGVMLHMEDAAGNALPPVRADAVVACDGVNSALRQSFYPDEQLAFTGINTWRGVTRRAPILDGRTYLRIGSIRTGKMVIYPIADDVDGNGGQLINWVAEIERPGARRNDWNRPGRIDDVLPIFAAWTFDWLDVPALIRGADAIFEYPMVDKDPIGRWSFGRVTLAGDAAHPMYPRGSNGSAQGLIDARTLADLLTETGDPVAAFAAYERARTGPTAAVVRTNRSHPPDVINIRVEELTGDRPFDNLDDIISQDELRALSESYKRIAGFALDAGRR